ncbi:Hypothetical predicted protein [Cloeon dipterum]|uniref:Uncharacterized protein n=1 Tax=Cloeon dipterum TaxID=197152 RepID=A0A8S1CU16_9INSE|nr:Hypothetical predicted protein [Cloeon dipterum]
MAKKALGPDSPPPPPQRRGEKKSGHDLTILKTELEHEKRLRRTILWSNCQLDRIIYELEDEIIAFDKADPDQAEPGNELWVRLETQKVVNRQLEQQRKWLELELEQTKRKIHAASKPAVMNFDLDLLTETELIRLVKRLERQRTDLYSNLRNLEFRLDREGREQQRLAEIKTMQQAEIYHFSRTLDRLKQTHRAAMIGNNQQHIVAASQPPPHKLPADPKLPPLDVVQLPTASTSRWGQASETKRTFNPNKGPVRKAAGVRNLPKINDKQKSIITTPRGKVDKRARRVKSANKDKRKEETKSAKNEVVPNPEKAQSAHQTKREEPAKAKEEKEGEDVDESLSTQLAQKLEIADESTKDQNSNTVDEKPSSADGANKEKQVVEEITCK